MNRTLLRWLVTGVLIASLFVVVAIGDKLGGKWVLLFPAYLLLVFVAIKLVVRRRGSSLEDPRRPFRRPWSVLVLLVAFTGGLLFGGPSGAVLAGLGVALAWVLVLGLQRTFQSR